MAFLGLQDRTFLVVGVANRKSVAYHIAKLLLDEGARVLLSVRDESMVDPVGKILPDCPIFVCDVAQQAQIVELGQALTSQSIVLHGLVHAVAFANYSDGLVPFHEVKREDFLQAVQVSMFSFTELANACRPCFADDASCITIGISTTSTAAENYGYMAPIKAALDSSVIFLAKSFSRFSRVRFNAVNPGLLKTSASAGIPGYVDSYLFAEKLTLRKENLRTEEVANVAAFLLSPRSSGINAQRIVIDAGMGVNAFDSEVVRKALD